MTAFVVSVCKKAVKLCISIFRSDFNASKCKTMTKMAVARIKLLRNKRDAVVKQMRRDIALLLQSRQDATARIRVEHVIREQNIMDANELLVLFCDLIVARLIIITKQRECPPDLKEGIASLIFAAPRSSDIPELLAIPGIFQKKYGKDFVSAATDLRPNAGVNRLLIEKLSVRTPSGEVKLKIMKEIAKEYQIDWDTAESEHELLKPVEELIEGPRTFVSASSLPVKPPVQRRHSEPPKPTPRDFNREEEMMDTLHYEDSASAAEAAAMSAKKAIEAAKIAAYLANKDPCQLPKAYNHNDTMNDRNTENQFRSQSIGMSHYSINEDSSTRIDDGRKVNRRHSYNDSSAHSGIKFDESDCDEEIEMEEFDDEIGANPPPNRPAPQVPGSQTKMGPRVHPKLPDYDELTARFDALKFPKARK